MTRVLLLAALALACAGAAIALTASTGAVPVSFAPAIGLCFVAAGALFLVGVAPRRPLPLALAGLIGVLWIGSALAAELGTIGDKAVILPWGDWLVALAVSLREPTLTILLPIIAAYIIQAIRKVYPWAALFLSQRRVEMMLEAGVGYGMNAVQGAAKGKTLSVNIAVPVVVKGTQYLIDTAPPALIKEVGGADGLAARMFRKLDLDEGASEATVLIPALDRIGGFAPPSADELRDADRMTRG